MFIPFDYFKRFEGLYFMIFFLLLVVVVVVCGFVLSFVWGKGIHELMAPKN